MKSYILITGSRGLIGSEVVKRLIKTKIPYIGIDVLRHRIILTYEAEAEELTSEDIIQRLFDCIEIP